MAEALDAKPGGGQRNLIGFPGQNDRAGGEIGDMCGRRAEDKHVAGEIAGREQRAVAVIGADQHGCGTGGETLPLCALPVGEHFKCERREFHSAAQRQEPRVTASGGFVYHGKAGEAVGIVAAKAVMRGIGFDQGVAQSAVITVGTNHGERVELY